MAFAVSFCPRNVEISNGQRCSYNVERKDKVNAHAIGVGGTYLYVWAIPRPRGR